jgi:hypothetical protein
MNHQTIFIVTSGEYAEYSLRAVFSQREQAERYAALHNGSYDDYRVEEHAVDDCVDAESKERFFVDFDLVKGTIWHKEFSGRAIAGKHVREEPAPIEYWLELLTRFGELYRLLHVVSYESREHAEQLAVEARQAMLQAIGPTENLWVDGTTIFKEDRLPRMESGEIASPYLKPWNEAGDFVNPR